MIVSSILHFDLKVFCPTLIIYSVNFVFIVLSSMNINQINLSFFVDYLKFL